MHVGERIKELLVENRYSQTELAQYLSVSKPAITKLINTRSPSEDRLEKVASFFSISVDELLGQASTSNSKFAKGQYVELPFVSIKARASFLETFESGNSFETVRVFVEENESVKDNIVIEVDGDSMEPYYISGMKVRAKLISSNDWEYIVSGVYFVAYRDFFVFKRIKTNDLLEKQMLILHSDNLDTGGTQSLRKEDIRHIWKALSIVYAPIR